MDFDFPDWLRQIPGNYLIVAVILSSIASAAFLAISFMSLRDKRPRLCEWKKDALQPHQGTTQWICTRCGESGFSKNARPPVSCSFYTRTKTI